MVNHVINAYAAALNNIKADKLEQKVSLSINLHPRTRADYEYICVMLRQAGLVDRVVGNADFKATKFKWAEDKNIYNGITVFERDWA